MFANNNNNNNNTCCRLGCVEKEHSSHLTSIDISNENKLSIPNALLSKMYLIEPQENNCVCTHHNMEFKQLFQQPSSSSLYTWEYDEKAGTVSYIFNFYI
jgi:hypothetical protein